MSYLQSTVEEGITVHDGELTPWNYMGIFMLPAKKEGLVNERLVGFIKVDDSDG